MEKEEILLMQMHKIHPRYEDLESIFKKGKLKLILKAMEIYANIKSRDAEAIKFAQKRLGEIINHMMDLNARLVHGDLSSERYDVVMESAYQMYRYWQKKYLELIKIGI